MIKDIHIGGSDYVNIKTSTVVKLREDFTIMSEEGPITISVDINADFVGIPQKYHEIFLNVLTSKYLNKVSYGDNQFSQCKPVTKRKWFQFWKSKYFSQQ
jgi:hypothetical protein